jgi:CheY-like chemotaxis protein
MSGVKRILLIDDDPDFRASVRALLESVPYEVHEETEGDAGLRAARAAPPDMILLDVMMRERTEGFFVLREIRRTPALAAVPVVVCSSLYSEHPFFRVREDAGWLPADLFLPKPLRPPELLQEVARLLAGVPAEPSR